MTSDFKDIDAYVDIAVKGKAPVLKIPSQACLTQGPVDPFSIVIFGATGDLTARKLFPALYNLYLHGAFPESFAIIGAARAESTDDRFRERMNKALEGMDI